MKRSSRLPLAALILVGCIKEVPNEQRLDEATAQVDSTSGKDFTELLKLRCDELRPAWAKIREEPSEERQLTGYGNLHDELKSRSTEFERATSRNPDLLYQKNSQQLVDAQESCTQMAADLRLEFETKVRELVALPIVEDIRGGKTVKVARLSFERLKAAVEKLEMDDQDLLLTKLAVAEKSLSAASTKKRGTDD